MKVDLKKHNKKASNRIRKMLETEERACIIHATGTGKSYIILDVILYLLEQNSSERILAVTSASPTLEQLRRDYNKLIKAAVNRGEIELALKLQSQVDFCLYASLKNHTRDKITFLICDEFHHTGARETSKKLDALIENNRENGIRMLGTSATSEHSVDKKDMAYVLFKGNVASRLTVYDAMTKEKILPIPEYILTVFCEQDELSRNLEKLEYIDPPVQTKRLIRRAEKCIHNSGGLKELFDNNLKYPDGKYLVFCKNTEHMALMMEKAKEWFSSFSPQFFYQHSKVNPIGQNYDSFKRAKGPGLKLMFSVNMYIEGVHLEDVDGIIILRPTKMDNILTQILGRVLTITQRNREPQIFDIVDNLNVLQPRKRMIYSCVTSIIDPLGSNHTVELPFAVQVKMSNDEFTEVMEKIRAVTSNRHSWLEYYNVLTDFYVKHHHIKVPKDKTIGGLNLYRWLIYQRYLYHHGRKLAPEKIQLLEDLGINWNDDPIWDEFYEEAVEFYNLHGHLMVNRSNTPPDSRLYGWIIYQRRRYRGTVKPELTDEQIKKLEAIGMVWDPKNILYHWQVNFDKAYELFLDFGHLDFPSKEEYLTINRWLNTQADAYQEGKLSDEQRKKLEKLGFRKGVSLSFLKKYQRHQIFYLREGRIPTARDKKEDAYTFYRWIGRQRKSNELGVLSEEEQKLLTGMGINLALKKRAGRK